MNPNIYDVTSAWSAAVSKRLLWPFYRRWANENQWVSFDRAAGSKFIQRELCVDYALTDATGSTLLIEEKLTQIPPNGLPYPTFLLEFEENHNVPGWMQKTRSDRLVYGFCIDDRQLDCFIFDMAQLRQFGAFHAHRFRSLRVRRSQFVMVPAHILSSFVANTARYWIIENGPVRALDPLIERRAGVEAAVLAADAPLPPHYPVRPSG